MELMHSGTALTAQELAVLLATVTSKYPDADVRFISNYEDAAYRGIEAVCLHVSLKAPQEADTLYLGTSEAVRNLIKDYETEQRNRTEQAVLLHNQATGSVKPERLGEWYAAFLYIAALDNNYAAAAALPAGTVTGVTQEWTTKTPNEVYALCFPKSI